MITKPISFASDIAEDFHKQLTENRDKYKDNILEEHISMNVLPTGIEQPKFAGMQPKILMQTVYCCFMVVKTEA